MFSRPALRPTRPRRSARPARTGRRLDNGLATAVLALRADADCWYEASAWSGSGNWENQGTEADIDLIPTAAIKSNGRINLNTGDFASTVTAQRLALTAATSATMIVIGTFGFTGVNYPIGSRTSTTNTASNAGMALAMRSDGNIRLYVANGVTALGGTDRSMAAHVGQKRMYAVRFDRAQNRCTLHVNGVEVENFALGAIGELEATSNMNIGTAGLPGRAGDLIDAFIYDRRVYSDQELAQIRQWFGA